MGNRSAVFPPELEGDRHYSLLPLGWWAQISFFRIITVLLRAVGFSAIATD